MINFATSNRGLVVGVPEQDKVGVLCAKEWAFFEINGVLS